jgi:RimJ/RimL family protein N-acetyltransferase
MAVSFLCIIANKASGLYGAVRHTAIEGVLTLNPILLDFPAELYTERLYIRMPMPGDGKAVYSAIQASLTELKPWLPFAQKEQTESGMEAGIREAHAKFVKREDMRLLLFRKDTGQFIGSSGLHNPNWDIPKFEIGYWLDTRYSGHGYMTEAVRGIAAFAFHELKARRVEIRCDSRNTRSRAIPERLGFDLEGTLRNEDLSADGREIRNTAIYAKLFE